ncbi:extracellular solute-binding protein [Candidatus Poriferisodalis multihospitum]|uniref:extracellular solute-binding protein n=1 Tax=Candidatus Poriferisodalis multihospitum TaxID=2983191 RepID=UPI002B25DB80|nr:extracellular solute-binding protein [Candidatus Poriferisodalis multihospitum]
MLTPPIPSAPPPPSAPRPSSRRRRLTRLAVLATSAALIASACGSARTLEGPAVAIYDGECADAGDRQLTVYSGRTENLIQPVLDAFECETGVDVAVRWGASTDLALLLAEEGDRTSADVFLSRSPGPVGFLENKDLLGTVDAGVAELVDSENRSGSRTWVGFTGRKRVLVYNLDNVAGDELPASVFDLTDERYRGRVAIPATNGSFVDWFTVFRHQHGDDAVTQWLDDMVANDARYYPNNRSIVEAAGRGEIDMGLVNHYYQYQVAEAIGDGHRAANWDFAGSDIGSLLIITAATVTAASEHTAAANEFIAYLLSAPVQQYFSSETLEYPLAAGVAPADVLPSLGGPEVGSLDFDSLGEGFARSTEIIEASGILNE